MVGERTPDTSDGSSSSGGYGSPDDVISLREHMQRQIETEHRFFEAQMREHRVQLDERFDAQTKALNERLESRERSVKAALKASDSQIAMEMQAAKDAVQKAEIATDKRFESVNEFRAQLADQSNTFMPRSESIQRHDATGNRVSELEKRMTESLAVINSRLDRTQGTSTGIDKAWSYLIAAVGLAGAVIAIILTFNQ